MTVRLQRGDRIFLSFPYTSQGHWTTKEHTEAAHKEAEGMINMFRKYGVEVVQWSANQNLTHPAVVAVLPPKDPVISG